MLTVAGSIDASSAAMAGLEAAMEGAGRSVAALSAGEKDSVGASASVGTSAPQPARSEAITGSIGHLLEQWA